MMASMRALGALGLAAGLGSAAPPVVLHVATNGCHHGAREYVGRGIYLDEGTVDVPVENNIAYRTTPGASA
jgi:hypothetical protein